MTPTPDEQASLRRISPVTLLSGAIITVAAMGIGLFGVSVLAQTGRQTFQAHQTVNHVTLNAVVNNPTHGDERNFVLIREVGGREFTDEVTLQPGREYEVYNYYHNNASVDLNASGKGIATGVRLQATLPSVVTKQTPASIVGKLFTDNATPQLIEDSVTVSASKAVSLRLVSGSAVVYSNGPVNEEVLPDSFVTTGTLLGFDHLDGVLPGGAEHAGYVIYRVTATEADCEATNCAGALVTELPRTGVEQTTTMIMSGMLLTAAIAYYLLSRRAIHRSDSPDSIDTA